MEFSKPAKNGLKKPDGSVFFIRPPNQSPHFFPGLRFKNGNFRFEIRSVGFFQFFFFENGKKIIDPGIFEGKNWGKSLQNNLEKKFEKKTIEKKMKKHL